MAGWLTYLLFFFLQYPMKPRFNVGQLVEARYQAAKYGVSNTFFFRGKIIRVDERANKTLYDVEYGMCSARARMRLWPVLTRVVASAWQTMAIARNSFPKSLSASLRAVRVSQANRLVTRTAAAAAEARRRRNRRRRRPFCPR